MILFFQDLDYCNKASKYHTTTFVSLKSFRDVHVSSCFRTVDPSLAEAVSSLIWASPRVEADVAELKTISDQFAVKFGKKYIEVGVCYD